MRAFSVDLIEDHSIRVISVIHLIHDSDHTVHNNTKADAFKGWIR